MPRASVGGLGPTPQLGSHLAAATLNPLQVTLLRRGELQGVVSRPERPPPPPDSGVQGDLCVVTESPHQMLVPAHVHLFAHEPQRYGMEFRQPPSRAHGMATLRIPPGPTGEVAHHGAGPERR